MKLLLTALLAILAFPLTAHADQSTAKEIARINNCNPKKIDVYQQTMGENGKTIYQVECVMPKVTDTSAPANPPSGLLISCDDIMCDLIRPISIGDKK